jgi:type VI secretion system secreted protein VgrG
MSYTQQGRLLSIDTPLGKDVLLLQGLAGHEAISRQFAFHLDLLSENHSVAYDQIVGQKVTVTVATADGGPRYISGIVSRFAQAGTDFRFTHYQAEVVPWLWCLTRLADSRIFQDMTIPDIITKVFRDRGFTDYKNSLQGTYDQREYCVQYRETDFNFVSRLMEQYGIFYFFQHENGKHTLVLADAPGAHKPCPGQNKARFVLTTGQEGVAPEDAVTSWQIGQELRTGKYSLTDYNFETPSTSLLANEATVINVDGNSKFEIYDQPGVYLKKAQGESLAKVRMQEQEASHKVASGTSSCRGFASGYKFSLTDHYRKDLNASYVLTDVQHKATVGGCYVTGDDSGAHYSNQFACIPADVPFRPARLSPKPFVQGPQTAVVVGKSGEEIWTDKYGRVKVQFHWDREGKKDENSSCWIRVSQPWAGKSWGGIWIPRIGQEVIVDFLEGDPDRPIITGRVYNAEVMPPYKLPDNQTRSTFMSRSSKGGASANYNEIRFEDKKGSEQIFINAEKDMDLRVENDSREYVMKDRHLLIDGNQLEKVKGNKDAQVTGDHKEKVGGDVSLQIGGSRDEKVGMKHALESGQEIHLKAGMKVIMEAGMQLTIKAAGGFVDIGPAGVTIQGTMVLINSGGAAGTGSGSSPKNPKDPDTADDGSKGTKM